MLEIESLIGKPIVIFDKDGRKRPVGTIVRAHADKHGITISGSVTDLSLVREIEKDSAKNFKIGG